WNDLGSVDLIDHVLRFTLALLKPAGPKESVITEVGNIATAHDLPWLCYLYEGVDSFWFVANVPVQHQKPVALCLVQECANKATPTGWYITHGGPGVPAKEFPIGG